MSATDQLAFPAPRSEAATDLTALLHSQTELEKRLDDLDIEQRHAGEEVARLSAELTTLERRSLEGEQVSDAQRTKAEQALTKAKAASAAPWGERRQAIQQAIMGHRNRVQSFIAEHLGELVAEVEEDGRNAAQTVDAAAQRLVAAYQEREHVAQRLRSLVMAVRGRSEYGDVTNGRAEPVAREAERLLTSGGEDAPRLRDELRPGHEQPVTDVPVPVVAE